MPAFGTSGSRRALGLKPEAYSESQTQTPLLVRIAAGW
jgi:hypothetical protein